MSNFVVSARKYRPIRFDEVVGQEHVSQTLKNAMINNHLAHAFLFCGPRGVGKTTCARILAKVLNCENITADNEPCNTCSSCESFNNNASFNITELDAASNNSVEHIRALIEQVRFQPQQGKYKIYIIDEVHMLSQQAFNAFLKTLEEPPPYAKFILATTEKHKILPTILSRCQIFDFNRIQIPSMVAHLESICQSENIDAEKDALHIIAQKADGALRDALSIFDRIVSFSNEKITYDDVISNLNVLDYDYYFQILDAMLVENISKVLLVFDTILRKGFDAEVFINGIAEHFRNILVCQDEATIQLLEVGDALKVRYRDQAKITPKAFLLTALGLANDCDVNYKMARNKRLHVEMSLIKMAYINRAIQVVQNPYVEKKTTDQSVAAEEPSIYNKQATPDLPVVKETPKQPTKSTGEDVKSKLASLSKPKSTSKIGARSKLGIGGSMKINIAHIEEEVKAEEKKEELKENKLTQAHLTQSWKKFIDRLESDFAKSVFKNATAKLIEKEINITVGKSIAENHIRQEKELMPFLKRELGANDLSLAFTVDRSTEKQAPKPKKPLTDREKFKTMRDTNPNLMDLQRRFGLFPDK